MIERAELLHSAAGQIDGLDSELDTLNDHKKAVYHSVKEAVPPADYKAWREAVKLRQRRRVDREASEAHEGRVADMLFMLETDLPREATETPVAPVSGPAIGIVVEPAPYAGAPAPAREAHNPETGELSSEAVVRNMRDEWPDRQMRDEAWPEIPAAFDRRRRGLEAAS